MRKLWIALVIVAVPLPLAGQRMVERTPGVPFDDAAQIYEKLAGDVRARVAVEAQVTPGAPYSAEAMTEVTQLLADGNRINRKSITRVYRDGEGRTRREDLDESGSVVSISIVDPVAHVSYVLNPTSRTAYRDSMRIVSDGRGVMMKRSADVAGVSSDGEAGVRSAGPPPPPPPPPPSTAEIGALERTGFGRGRAPAPSREDLGQQNMEGVNATGSRTTTTIPPGAIGNVQPIKVVVEQWVSPELNVLIMTRHNDPRIGETTYRLQSIVRAEPDRSLFTVPPDYALKESGIREPFK